MAERHARLRRLDALEEALETREVMLRSVVDEAHALEEERAEQAEYAQRAHAFATSLQLQAQEELSQMAAKLDECVSPPSSLGLACSSPLGHSRGVPSPAGMRAASRTPAARSPPRGRRQRYSAPRTTSCASRTSSCAATALSSASSLRARALACGGPQSRPRRAPSCPGTEACARTASETLRNQSACDPHGGWAGVMVESSGT